MVVSFPFLVACKEGREILKHVTGKDSICQQETGLDLGSLTSENLILPVVARKGLITIFVIMTLFNEDMNTESW